MAAEEIFLENIWSSSISRARPTDFLNKNKHCRIYEQGEQQQERGGGGRHVLLLYRDHLKAQ